MKILFVVLMLLSLCKVGWADEDPSDTPNPNTSDTPNLNNPNVIWTQTSPRTQMALSAGDMLFIISLQSLEDREFRQALKVYKAQQQREKYMVNAFKQNPTMESRTILQNERAATERARVDLRAEARRVGVKRIPLRLVRWIGTGFFLVDLGSRAALYFIADEDPGWLAIGHLYRRLTSGSPEKPDNSITYLKPGDLEPQDQQNAQPQKSAQPTAPQPPPKK